MGKLKIPGWIKAVVKIAVSAAALYLVFSKINIPDLLKYLKTCQWGYLFPATILFILSKVVSSFRLNVFFRKESLAISQLSNWNLYLLGMYYNLFLPGGIGGDGYKVYYLNKETGTKVKPLLTAILADRITGVYALFVLLTVLVYMLPFPDYVFYTAWALIPLSVLVFRFLLRKFSPQYLPVFAITNLQSFLVQLLQLASVLFLLLSFDLTDRIWAYFFIFLVSSVVATIPFTIGGVGARELTFLYGASFLGLSQEVSVTISLLFYLITAVVSLSGIWYSFRRVELG
ncbi:MAG: flippase-like domain-containing protein [Bacteroidetes bacterium]|nr:flippase-like domain-containing protein [Bacteroidota bacterium]MBU1719683.1 flippase-like domain-containing protein [Bacteroidota bacterium]